MCNFAYSPIQHLAEAIFELGYFPLPIFSGLEQRLWGPCLDLYKKPYALILGLVFLSEPFSLQYAKVSHNTFFEFQAGIVTRQHSQFLQSTACQ